jgi:hypothetical protein
VTNDGSEALVSRSAVTGMCCAAHSEKGTLEWSLEGTTGREWEGCAGKGRGSWSSKGGICGGNWEDKFCLCGN